LSEAIDVQKILESREYKPGYKPPAEDILLTIMGENIGSRGNFVVLSGLPKAGKSTYLGAIIASAYTHYEIFTIKLQGGGNIGYFDTESSTNDFYNNLYRIRSFAGYIDFPRTFKAYSTRIDPFEMQRALIEKYIELYKPSVLIIDGLLDLIQNYNDERESRALMDWLKYVTASNSMLIIGCIHLGKKDNHTLGHFGSMVDRYAQSVLEIVKDRENNLFLLKPKWLRSAPDFLPIAIQKIGHEYKQVLAPAPAPPKKR
jgi:hypothetical protein